MKMDPRIEAERQVRRPDRLAINLRHSSSGVRLYGAWMAISFDPSLGQVLLCDFSTGFQPPEMVKRRPALVVSPRLHGRSGLCTVVPLSTTPARRGVTHQCRITLPQAPPPPFSEREVWAKADMLATVGFGRLDLFRSGRDAEGRRNYLKIMVSEDDLGVVRQCIRAALGL